MALLETNMVWRFLNETNMYGKSWATICMALLELLRALLEQNTYGAS
jgi:hypothetical protein